MDGFFHSCQIPHISSNCNSVIILELVNYAISKLSSPSHAWIFTLQLAKCCANPFLHMANTLFLLNCNSRSLIYILYLTKAFAVAIPIIFSILQVMKFHRSPEDTVNTFRFHGRSRTFEIGFACDMVCSPSQVFQTVLV